MAEGEREHTTWRGTRPRAWSPRSSHTDICGGTRCSPLPPPPGRTSPARPPRSPPRTSPYRRRTSPGRPGGGGGGGGPRRPPEAEGKHINNASLRGVECILAVIGTGGHEEYYCSGVGASATNGWDAIRHAKLAVC
eukprot:1176491-Prorocentrum_minimum.AAC.1